MHVATPKSKLGPLRARRPEYATRTRAHFDDDAGGRATGCARDRAAVRGGERRELEGGAELQLTELSDKALLDLVTLDIHAARQEE